MLRYLLIATVLAFAIPMAAPVSAATAPCKPTATKKCPDPKKTTAKKTTKAKKSTKAAKGRSDYTAEQRKQMMERAREICRKEVGASSTVYRIDYSKNRVICWRPGA
jgi:hypothetical protein